MFVGEVGVGWKGEKNVGRTSMRVDQNADWVVEVNSGQTGWGAGWWLVAGADCGGRGLCGLWRARLVAGVEVRARRAASGGYMYAWVGFVRGVVIDGEWKLGQTGGTAILNGRGRRVCGRPPIDLTPQEGPRYFGFHTVECCLMSRCQ